MAQVTIDLKESNKLIAEFMGGKQCDGGFIHSISETEYFRLAGLTNPIHPRDMQYHSSWDWLMPVLEKIETCGYVVRMGRKYCKIGGDIHEVGNSKIIATNMAVIKFIETYKEDLKSEKQP